jgi:Calpain family cysteine protease
VAARAPALSSPAGVLGLQRTAGNAAVQRLVLAREAATAPLTDINVPSSKTEHRSLRHLRHAGTPFVRDEGEHASGVDVSDIRQGALGDCFFLSPLMAIARINPQRIRNLIRGPIGQTRVGANVYEVTLYTGEDEEPRVHRIDDRFVSDADGNTVYAGYGDMSALGPELWVMLMEKAWAADQGGYQAIHFGRASVALRALTGEDSTWTWSRDEDEEDIIDDIADAVDDGEPVICNTFQTLSNDVRQMARDLGFPTLVPAHSYNVSWVDRERQTLNVRNPHGRNHLIGLPVSAFKQIFEGYYILDDDVR